MKSLIFTLVILFAFLQYKLWFEKGAVGEVSRLRDAIELQSKQNTEITNHNQGLAAEVKDLKSGQAAVEERARNDLGMIKSGEVFYQIIPGTSKK